MAQRFFLEEAACRCLFSLTWRNYLLFRQQHRCLFCTLVNCAISICISTAYMAPSLSNRENLLSRLSPQRGQHLFDCYPLPARALMISDRQEIRGIKISPSFQADTINVIKLDVWSFHRLWPWSMEYGKRPERLPIPPGFRSNNRLDQSWPITRCSWPWTIPWEHLSSVMYKLCYLWLPLSCSSLCTFKMKCIC